MAYIPARSDIVWMNFDPQKGREQAGYRPALILSPVRYNRNGLAIVCPITGQRKGYWSEVPIAAGKIKDCVLADHVKSHDWKDRRATFAGKAQHSVLEEVQSVLSILLTDD